jgi:hypothetical protein
VLDFDSLCIETFNEEQSIKRNEAHSYINLGSALKTGNGKEKEASINDSGKISSRRSVRRWKCKTYKTNEHAWFECSENPNSKNYKSEKIDETKDKKEGGASAVTLKLDGIPSDLLLQPWGWLGKLG